MRPRLPDAAARKQLATLLLLRLKLPGEHGNGAKEVVSLLVESQDSQQLQEAFGIMEESDIVTLLSSLDETAVKQLHVGMLPRDHGWKGLVDKEVARRLASQLNEGCLKMLWQLLQGHLDSEQDSWAQAAACFLSAQMGRIEVHLANLSSKVLAEARKFLDDQVFAIAFAKDFFACDLGISSAKQWPLKSTAPIFNELATRVSEDKSEEKLQLLLKGYDIAESDLVIRASLYKLLHARMLSQNGGDAYAMEGLFLKLALEEGCIPEEVLAKLTLGDHHLIQVSPELLMKLCHQLADSDRPADGARVALVAARGFTAECQARQSEEAFLKAFSLEHSNQEAAEGLANAVTSAHERCAELEYWCEELQNNGRALEAKCQALQKEMQGIQNTRREGSAEPSSILWDLSGYDFSGFRKGECQKSEKFQLLSSGLTAWLLLYPKGGPTASEGKATLYLRVDKPATVKWSCQSGSGEVQTSERNFSKDLRPNGTPDGYGWRNFMPISEANGSITLRILSVQLPGSKLRFS